VSANNHWSVMLALGLAAASHAQAPAFFDPPTPEKRLHLRAERAATPPMIDGRLDDPAWLTATPTSPFFEIEPHQLQRAANQTQVKVTWDDTALYVSARLEQPGGWRTVNQRDMRRDFRGNESDSFGVVIDPLGDGRNALLFGVNPWGAQRDIQVLDDSLFEDKWDTVWSSATTRDDNGWSVELAIPWKSIRYGPAGTTWHVQFFRRQRGINVDSAWSPYPRTVSPFRMPYAGVLDGLEPPAPRLLSVQLRPYAIARFERVGDAPIKAFPSAGGEATWTPSSSTVVDLTVNTDFAETDVDRLVVNLSRFSVFFPERRQFFLESAGVFSSGFDGYLQPFFSRSIGLVGDGQVPITAGARAVYRTVDSSAGALVVNTLSTNVAQGSVFGVARYSHNFGEQSRLGGMVVLRHDLLKADAEAVTNVVPVLDGFYRTGPFTLSATGMGSSTTTAGRTQFGGAGTLDLGLQGNWGAFDVNMAGTTPRFEALTGFVARPNTFGFGTNGYFDYRPSWLPSAIRAITPSFNTFSLWSSDRAQFQEVGISVSPVWFLMTGGDEAGLFVNHSTSILTETFEPVPKVSFAPGSYQYETIGATAFSQASRKVSVGADVSGGSYYTASVFSASARASVQPIPHIQVSGSYAYNRFWGKGVTGSFADTHLLLLETRLALNPRLQLIGSYQRDTASNATVLNARLAWEFLPLSFVYLVFTDTRSAYPAPDAPASEQRLVAKVTYTWRL
jgi:Carbohydrate family 9 binding domain-like/Domain of unknown function (DUF5916)